MSQEELEELIGNSTVRCNLLLDINYRPYCGNFVNCYMPRTEYRSVDGQFICPNCKWISSFPEAFVKAYKEVHGLI